MLSRREQLVLNAGLFEGIAGCHLSQHAVKVVVVECSRPGVYVLHGLHKGQRVSLPGEHAQAVQIFLAKERRDDDATGPHHREFGIHHEPRESTIAIIRPADRREAPRATNRLPVVKPALLYWS